MSYDHFIETKCFLYQYLVVIAPVRKNILYSFYGNALGISLMITNSKNHRKLQLFHDGSPYHIETSPLICSANQCTGFYMIGTTIMKEPNSKPLTFCTNIPVYLDDF